MSFVFPQKVLFRHCDPAGIVFFPRYFEMINDCVEAFFDSEIGHPFEHMHPLTGVPTAEISARFVAPSRHGDRLSLALEVRTVGRSSTRFEITATCGDETRFAANSVLVHVGETGRPHSWPPQVWQKLLGHLKKDDQ